MSEDIESEADELVVTGCVTEAESEDVSEGVKLSVPDWVKEKEAE